MVLQSIGILPHHYTRHNPEDLDFNLHCLENLKPCCFCRVCISQ